MSGIRLQNIDMLHLLWMVPFLIALLIYAWQRRRRALEIFIDSGLLDRIHISASTSKRNWQAVALLVAMMLVIFAMARPAWNPKPETVERRGRDVVFLLDVSNSMLAEDLVPNRLERAKLAIRDCVERLQGDRVALVAFAGTAAIKCPLTLGYGFFQMKLEDLSIDSNARGVTKIGEAIRKIMTDV